MKKISTELNNNSSEKMHDLLNKFGVSKDEVLASINQLKNSNISEEQLYSMVNNLSEDNLKKINEKKDDIEKIYKDLLDSNKR